MAEDLEDPPQGWLSGWLPAWRPTSMSHLKNVEARILQCLQSRFVGRYVTLPGWARIWTVSLCPEQGGGRTPLVLVHGFGGGVGLWVLNLDRLGARRPLHAFDLLGFGRSSRPAFPRDAQGAEAEFVRSIEGWRQQMGISAMILLGHSLGGFLAASYSLAYPERVKHLILVDPWGFPVRPTDPNQIQPPPNLGQGHGRCPGTLQPPGCAESRWGPWGPGLVQRFRPDFKQKFAEFFEDDTIPEYIYHCNASPGRRDGVQGHDAVLGWARRPMLERIQLLPRELPITLIYGAESWIDTSTGRRVRSCGPTATSGTWPSPAPPTTSTPTSPAAFNAAVQEICDSVD
ncbi:unnamed protein product [Eretmochelys imbricata]